MKVTITSRHLELDDDIRSYAEKKLRKAETYFDHIIEAHMILSAEKHRRIADVTLNAKHTTFHAAAETENIYASIDSVVEKVDIQVKKYKEKLRNRKHRTRGTVLALEEENSASAEEDPEAELQIIKVRKFASKPMTAQEAVVQMNLSRDEFLVFSNSQTNRVNVVYKRKDGKYGWIEPDFE